MDEREYEACKRELAILQRENGELRDRAVALRKRKDELVDRALKAEAALAGARDAALEEAANVAEDALSDDPVWAGHGLSSLVRDAIAALRTTR